LPTGDFSPDMGRVEFCEPVCFPEISRPGLPDKDTSAKIFSVNSNNCLKLLHKTIVLYNSRRKPFQLKGLEMSQKKSRSIRSRLIETAGELFSEKGFKGTTIRSICKRAEANLAAVNYHFKGKEHLFEEVVRHVVETGWSKYPVGYGIDDAKTDKDKLGAFIRIFLLRIFDPERPAWHGRLMRREILLVGPKAIKYIKKYMVKNDELLVAITRGLLGPKSKPELVRLCCASVIGQMLIFVHPKPDKEHPFDFKPTTIEEIEEIACHIAGFSLAGIRDIKKTLTHRGRKVKK